MEKLAFTIGFMSHSEISSIGFESRKEEGGWEDGLGILCENFPNLLSSHRGIHIWTRKGGGQGKK